jgi:hypothetical protein
MSALPPKADIGTQSRDVRFVPKADIHAPQQLTPPLLQEIVNFRQQFAFHSSSIMVVRRAL